MEFDGQAGARDRRAVETLLSEMAGSERTFIYTSGVWVYGDTNDRMLGEIAALNPPPLVAWRPAVEEIVRDAADRKLKTMVFRPGMVFGRGGGVFRGWYESAKTEMRPFAGCLAMDCKAGSTKAARFFGWGPKHPNIVAELEIGA